MTAGLGQIAIAARDLRRSTAFYSEVLGLRLGFEAPNVTAYEVAGVRLLLTVQPGSGAAAAASVIPYFTTVGLEARHSAMIAAGAADGGAPHRIADLGGRAVWIAFILDPSGNRIGLIEER